MIISFTTSFSFAFFFKAHDWQSFKYALITSPIILQYFLIFIKKKAFLILFSIFYGLIYDVSFLWCLMSTFSPIQRQCFISELDSSFAWINFLLSSIKITSKHLKWQQSLADNHIPFLVSCLVCFFHYWYVTVPIIISLKEFYQPYHI